MSSLPSTTPHTGKKKQGGLTTSTLLLVIGASAVSFIAGNMFAMSFNQCSSLSSPALNEVKNQKEDNVISVTREGAFILSCRLLQRKLNSYIVSYSFSSKWNSVSSLRQKFCTGSRSNSQGRIYRQVRNRSAVGPTRPWIGRCPAVVQFSICHAQ